MHVKFFTLVYVYEEYRRLWLMQLVVIARLRGVKKVAQRDLPIQELVRPARLKFGPPWIYRVELPPPQERFNKRPHRFGAWLELEEAPAAARVEGRRPRVGCLYRFWPCLPHQGSYRARLRQR